MKWLIKLLRKIFGWNPQIPIFDPANPWYPLVLSDDFRWGVDWTKWDWREPWSGNSDTQKHKTIWKQSCLDKREDGLHLIAHKGPDSNECGMICSHKFLKLKPNSYFSVVVKVPPKGKLYFPAPLWAYGKFDQEIDVIEIYDEDSSTMLMTHHWLDANGKHQSEGSSYKHYEPLSNAFHVYSVLWEKDRLTWYFDGIIKFTTTNNIPTEEMYIISNIQSGGPEGQFNHLFTSNEVPMSMIVKKIEVYQK